MATKPDPRRRFIDLLEQEATAAGCETASHFARYIAARLDALGLAIVAIPDHERTSTGQITPAEQVAERVPEYAAAKQALAERNANR